MLGGITPAEKAVIANVIQGAGQTVNGQYYSRVRFTTTVSLPTYTIAANQLKKAFAYSQGADMAPAIGITGTTAQPSDTNLTAPSQTVGGQSILIRGVAIQFLAWSDPIMAKQLDPVTSVALVMNGTQRTYMGIPSMLPGTSGWYGQAESQVPTPNPLQQFETQIGAFTNGLPHIDNYFRFVEPVVWLSAGKRDSMLNIELNNYSAVTNVANYGAATRTAFAETSTFSGTNAFTPLTTAQLFVDFMVILVGVPFQPESLN